MPTPTGRSLRRPTTPGQSMVTAIDPNLGESYLYCEGEVTLLFTENETNTQRIFGVPNRTPYVKDSINDYVVQRPEEAVDPEKGGTKVAAHYRLTVAPGAKPGGSPAAERRRSGRLVPGNGKRGALRQAIRQGAANPPPGGRRVLRRHHSASSDRRRGQRHAPSLGGNVVEQAVLSLRRGQVARRARLGPLPADAKGRSAERPMAPHVQRRRNLHAGQVGVSLVRGLGPGLPRVGLDSGGSSISASSSSS